MNFLHHSTVFKKPYESFTTSCPPAHANVSNQNFQNPGTVAPATNSRLAPLNPERADYNYGFGATVDIPLDTSTVCLLK